MVFNSVDLQGCQHVHEAWSLAQIVENAKAELTAEVPVGVYSRLDS